MIRSHKYERLWKSLIAGMVAGGSALGLLAGEQPTRPLDFKPVTYPSPLELKEKFSEEVMSRAALLTQRVAEVNQQGKWKPGLASLDAHQAPEWWLDAKFGMFVDWGLYSVAGYAPNGYPDWYLSRMMENVKLYHDKVWGQDFRQDDFIQLFSAKDFDPSSLADVARASGMKYVVPFLKHHDGFCLWDSSFTMRNSVAMGPRRDIAREWVEACKKQGLKFGFYYSIDDWVYPIVGEDGNVGIRAWSFEKPKGWGDNLTMWDRIMISGKIPVRDFYDQYINPAAIEFINKYDPDIFWGDGDWRYDTATRKILPVAAYFLNHAAGRKEVCFNDRLGCCRGGGMNGINSGAASHGDFYCGEGSYSPDRSVSEEHPWEENSGLSHSFGYNWRETDKDVRTASDLVRMLVDIVSDGGNLLLITNLKPSGQLDPLMAARLKEVGNWLKVNGEAIYATRRWIRSRQDALRFTRSKDGKYVYVFTTKWPGRELRVIEDLCPVQGSAITMLGYKKPLEWSWNERGLVVALPESMETDRPCDYIWCFKVEAKPALAILAASTEIMPGLPVSARLRAFDNRLTIRYTLDGSLPTDSSPLYTAALTIASPCRLTAQCFASDKPEGKAVQMEFHRAASGVIPVPDIFIETLKPIKIERGQSTGGKDWRRLTCTGGPLSINGAQHANGIGLHAPAEAVFEIKPEYERFVAQAGVDDAGHCGSVRISVYADDQLLLKTAMLKYKQLPAQIDVAIPPGVDGRWPAQLRIMVDDGGDGIKGDHVDIISAGFVLGKK